MPKKKKEKKEEIIQETVKETMDKLTEEIKKPKKVSKNKKVKKEEAVPKYLSSAELHELKEIEFRINNFKQKVKIQELEIEKELLMLNNLKINFQNQIKDRENHINNMKDQLKNFIDSNRPTDAFHEAVKKLTKKYGLKKHWGFDIESGLIEETDG